MSAVSLVVWTWIGILAWRVYIWFPGEGQRLRAWAFALGLAGAWTGGYLAARIVHGGALRTDWRTVLGSVIGAALQIILFDFVARAIARRHELEGNARNRPSHDVR